MAVSLEAMPYLSHFQIANCKTHHQVEGHNHDLRKQGNKECPEIDNGMQVRCYLCDIFNITLTSGLEVNGEVNNLQMTGKRKSKARIKHQCQRQAAEVHFSLLTSTNLFLTSVMLPTWFSDASMAQFCTRQ